MTFLSYLPHFLFKRKLQTKAWVGNVSDKKWIEEALRRDISLLIRSDMLRKNAPTQTHPFVYLGNWAMLKWPDLKMACLENMIKHHAHHSLSGYRKMD